MINAPLFSFFLSMCQIDMAFPYVWSYFIGFKENEAMYQKLTKNQSLIHLAVVNSLQSLNFKELLG